MIIQESGENYLETILILKHQKGTVRSIDIVNHLGYSKPSVSNAMKTFRLHGYITVDPGGFITLTQLGLEIAQRIYQRHRLLTDFFCYLGISEGTAKEDACRIEHHISNESLEKIKEFCDKNLK